MSLSEFIGLSDVRAKLKEEFVKPTFSVKKEMLAPVITTDPRKIGTAFDYLLRFYANCLNPNAFSQRWVAENSLEILEKVKNNDTVIIDSKNRIGKARNINQYPASYIEVCKGLKNKAYSEAKQIVAEAKENLSVYLNSRKMSDNLIASALNLARLDVLYRAGYLPVKKSLEPDKKDMEDLRQLISIVSPKSFKARHTCVLNPVFGPEATKLMRADGDIIIDDVFIDIKTVKNLRVDRSIFNQLLGYYVLYKIGGIRGVPPNYKINKLGVYFSRYGYLHTYDVGNLADESKFLDFIAWFKKRALEFGLL